MSYDTGNNQLKLAAGAKLTRFIDVAKSNTHTYVLEITTVTKTGFDWKQAPAQGL